MIYVEVLFRWLHILPAIALMGGTIFMRFALLPALDSVRESERAALQLSLRSRWARVVMISIALLLISGITNLVFNFSKYKLPPAYHMLLTVKLLLALAIFFFASVLSGRSELATKFRQNAVRWTNITLTLAVLLVCISGVMKFLDHKPKAPVENVPAIAGEKS